MRGGVLRRLLWLVCMVCMYASRACTLKQVHAYAHGQIRTRTGAPSSGTEPCDEYLMLMFDVGARSRVCVCARVRLIHTYWRSSTNSLGRGGRF